MGRESTITQEEVNAAADQLRATGVKPTARAVREVLGGGSMATVLKHLQAWQSRQVRPPETQAGLPLGLQRALVDFIAQEVAGAKAALEADLVASQQANQDLIAESERLAASLEREQTVVESQTEEKAELSGRLAQLSKDLDEAKATAAAEREAAEYARTEKAKCELRLEGVPRLETEIERLKAAFELERNAKVVAEQAAAVAQARLEKTEAQAADLAARLAKAEAWLEEARGKAPSKP